MAKDALAAHARDELGVSEITTACPVRAALPSAVMFSVGAAMPLLMVVVSPATRLSPRVRGSLAFLALLGAIGARAGGAIVLHAAGWRRRGGHHGDGFNRWHWESFRHCCLKIVERRRRQRIHLNDRFFRY